MSCHYVYKKDGGAKYMRPILTREEYIALRNSGNQTDFVSRIRAGEEELKRNLVQFNYSCMPNDDGTLKGSKRMSNTVAMDIDHVPDEDMQPLKERILAKKDELGLKMFEESARKKGYHLVFTRHPELDQEANLLWASQLLSVAHDAQAKDITRVFFTTTESELIYLDDKLFEQEECHGIKNADITSSRILDSTEHGPTKKYPTSYHGIPFEVILKKYWEINNGGFEPTIGDRDTLTFQLASDLRHICGKNADWLDQVIPCYDNFPADEKRQKIANALASKYEGMPSRLKNVLDALERPNMIRQGLTDKQNLYPAEQSLPPEMPADKKLPKLIRLLTRNVANRYKAPVANAVFPPLATHLCQVRFNYTDNVEHEATLMNCLMAGTSKGKGCIDAPIEHIMADIKRRDAENSRREDEWKKDCQRKGANKDKQLRPEGLVIQEIDSDMTKPALVTRMDESEGHFVYVKLNEIDLFEQLKGQTGKQHFQLMCLAFDPGAEYGQTRVGTQSVTARPKCRFNWNACTTIKKGRRFFRNVLTDGPISRINFCTIVGGEIGEKQPVFGKYDAAFDEELKPYIDNLTAARGLIDCPQAFRLAKKLQDEVAEIARMSQDQTYWDLSHRAIVIAWLKACVLYVANGQKWEKQIEEFCRWSLHYDLWCKMEFFGADIDRAEYEDDREGHRGPKNLLLLLPDTFTIDDAKRICQQQGKDAERASKMISTWKSRDYVIQISDFSFKKLKYKKAS